VTLSDPRSLRAVTVEVPVDSVGDGLDLLSAGPWIPGREPEFVFGSQKTMIIGRGVAARLELPGGIADPVAADVATWLASVPVEGAVGQPGSGPIAIGALPFSRAQRASLIVPAWMAMRLGDRAWITAVRDASEPSPEPGALTGRLDRLRSAAAHTDRRPRLGKEPRATSAQRASLTHADEEQLIVGAEAFTWAVKGALDAIAAGTVAKVVLARRVDAALPDPVDTSSILRRLHRREPACTIFGILEPNESFLGATPEVLVSRRGSSVTSMALAGTVGLVGVDRVDRQSVGHLMRSPKERGEHRIVVDAIADTLAARCETLDIPETPSVVRLATVAHLGTPMHGVLRSSPGGPPDALQLAAALHPTPAVGGSPTEPALRLLRTLEEADRGRYAGPVGWVDGHGDGDFVVGIRSASIRGSTASVYAGAGIVAGSDPDAELAETTLKLKTAYSVLRPT
jgi:menaquinone-specific isochorismate synthase